jgi:hypothetical protein
LGNAILLGITNMLFGKKRFKESGLNQIGILEGLILWHIQEKKNERFFI